MGLENTFKTGWYGIMRVSIVGAFGTVTSAIIRKFGKDRCTRMYALTRGKNSEEQVRNKYMNSMIFLV